MAFGNSRKPISLPRHSGVVLDQVAECRTCVISKSRRKIMQCLLIFCGAPIFDVVSSGERREGFKHNHYNVPPSCQDSNWDRSTRSFWYQLVMARVLQRVSPQGTLNLNFISTWWRLHESWAVTETIQTIAQPFSYSETGYTYYCGFHLQESYHSLLAWWLVVEMTILGMRVQ